MSLDAQIEAILFFKGEPVSIADLAKILKTDAGNIEEAIVALSERLQKGGTRIIHKDKAVLLVTAPEASSLIAAITKEELSRDLSKAALETLSIILYYSPVSRGTLDYIRGVNSQFIVRNLLVRGLIEKIPNPDDKRGVLYRPTFDLLAHLGITNIEELPEYSQVQREIEVFKRADGDNANNFLTEE
jgi:segregation and condensation protein B